jgi:putative membrane-bound dehydrogenase-like protein
MRSLLALIACGLVLGAVGGQAPVDPPKMTPKRTDVNPFEYIEAKIPFYPPGGKGTKALNQMQLPLAAAESAKHMVFPEQFELQLFAAEPQIKRPICMNWDERGRLWIAETVDYPNSLQPKGQGNDRIVILEDTKGTGRADKFTVFADKLSIPTSFAFYKGGVIVHQAPHTLFLKSTKGDDVADVREVLFTGWRTYDTHAGPSNLRYGLDNWYWGIVGYAGFSGNIGAETHTFSQGFYRMRGDGSKLEFARSTNNNSWGVGISEEGLIFGSTANGNPSVYMPIANRYYEAVRGWSSSVLKGIAGNPKFYPITDKIRQVDFHGKFTAAAGHALYTARLYPKEYWNRAAFVAEPTGHLVATFQLQKQGTDFVSHNAWNLLASDDEWTAPIMAEVGPDGCVWIIDWYNYIVQHNPTPLGWKTGKGAAYDTELRDKKHGRIYRLVPKGAKLPAPLSLKDAAPEKLVATLRNDNMFWRLHAQRLLVERGKLDVVPALVELIEDPKVDAVGLNAGATHALWTLHGLGAQNAISSNDKFGTAATSALKHKSPGVRRNAVLVLQRNAFSVHAVLGAGLLEDAEPHVRLAALLSLSDMPPSDKAGAAIVAMLVRSENANDRWLPDAVTTAAAKHEEGFLTAVAVGQYKHVPRTLEVVRVVAEHYARGDKTSKLDSLVEALAMADADVAEAIVAGMAKGWPKGRTITLKESTGKALEKLMMKLPAGSQSQLLRLASRWGTQGLEKYADEISKKLLAVLDSDKESDSARIDAAKQLVDFRGSDVKVIEQILDTITPRTGPKLAAGLIDALGGSAAPGMSPTLIKRLDKLTPAARTAALRVLLARPDSTTLLLDILDAGKVQLAELTLDQKQALAGHPDAAIAERAKKLLERGGGLPSADRQKVIDDLMPLIKKTGDPKLGKLVFAKHCAVCHIFGKEGNKVGPDLTGIGVHPKAELLVHIFDPSRSVEGNYRLYTVTLNDGKILSGILASESKTAIELIDAEAKKHILLRDNIDMLVGSAKSLMPDGFEKTLLPDEIVHLLQFLSEHGQFVALPLGKVATAVSTLGMFNSKDSKAERLIFADWGPKTFKGVPFQLVDPQGDRVANVVLLYGPQGKIPPTMPKSVKLPCNTPAKAIHLLSGVSGWGYPGGTKGSVTMIVRLHYADGKTEDHPLLNGEHFADYIRREDVPQSEFAFALRGQQIRYLAIVPNRPEAILEVEFIKGTDQTAPVVMAVTVETR